MLRLLQTERVVVCTVEIVRAFTYVINQGWALYWATSRWSPVEIMASCTVYDDILLFHSLTE